MQLKGKETKKKKTTLKIAQVNKHKQILFQKIENFFKKVLVLFIFYVKYLLSCNIKNCFSIFLDFVGDDILKFFVRPSVIVWGCYLNLEMW